MSPTKHNYNQKYQASLKNLLKLFLLVKITFKKAIIHLIRLIMIVNAIFKRIMLKSMLKNLSVILIKIQSYLDHNKNYKRKNKRIYRRIFIIVQRESMNNNSRFNKLKYFRIGLLRFSFII